MGAEIAQLELELEERHKKELEEQKLKGESGGGGDDCDGAIEQHMEGLSLTSQPTEEKEGEGSAVEVAGGAGKKSRAQKRKVFSCKTLIHVHTPIHIWLQC